MSHERQQPIKEGPHEVRYLNGVRLLTRICPSCVVPGRGAYFDSPNSRTAKSFALSAISAQNLAEWTWRDDGHRGVAERDSGRSNADLLCAGRLADRDTYRQEIGDKSGPRLLPRLLLAGQALRRCHRARSKEAQAKRGEPCLAAGNTHSSLTVGRTRRTAGADLSEVFQI
jgi:hypothetical protein